MKIYIYKDEYYPYFGLSKPDKTYEAEIEVTDREWLWIKEIMNQFEEVQKFLKEKYNVRNSKESGNN